MKKILFAAIFMFAFLVSYTSKCQTTSKQDSTKNYRIETTDGNEFIGQIIDQNIAQVRLKTEMIGEITIPKDKIKTITEVTLTKQKDGNVWFENPQATRYFWTPNGYNLKEGEGYYQNVWIIFNQAVYGISNHFSAGIGTMPLFLFGGTPTPAWITLKFSVPVVENKFNLGAGALVGTVIGANNSGFGVLYGLGTFGSRDQNLNVGVGWAYAGGQIASTPTVNISGMIRTGPRGYIISENYFIGTSDSFSVLMSIGGRRIIRRMGLDFGAFVPLGTGVDTFVAVPWLGFTIPF